MSKKEGIKFMEDYYSVLEVSRYATSKEIKESFKRLQKLFHPDRHNQEGKNVQADYERISKKINEAYSVLGNPKRRREYNREYDKIPHSQIARPELSETSTETKENMDRINNYLEILQDLNENKIDIILKAYNKEITEEDYNQKIKKQLNTIRVYVGIVVKLLANTILDIRSKKKITNALNSYQKSPKNYNSIEEFAEYELFEEEFYKYTHSCFTKANKAFDDIYALCVKIYRGTLNEDDYQFKLNHINKLIENKISGLNSIVVATKTNKLISEYFPAHYSLEILQRRKKSMPNSFEEAKVLGYILTINECIEDTKGEIITIVGNLEKIKKQIISEPKNKNLYKHAQGLMNSVNSKYQALIEKYPFISSENITLSIKKHLGETCNISIPRNLDISSLTMNIYELNDIFNNALSIQSVIDNLFGQKKKKLTRNNAVIAIGSIATLGALNLINQDNSMWDIPTGIGVINAFNTYYDQKNTERQKIKN